LEPVSPINVFAGLKLNGINPSKLPASAVIIMILIKGEPFNEKIINKDTQEIIPIPEDNPSNPSIKLIAFVIPTIQIIVINSDGKKPQFILIPLYVTIIAAIICPISFTKEGMPLKSSIKQNMLKTIPACEKTD
jgi:hypothetical protein